MTTEIKDLVLASDVSDVRLQENRESLVAINELRPDKMVVFSKAYQDGKEGSIITSYVRETIRGMLIEVADALPEGYKLAVWETFTPKSLHEALSGKTLTYEDMKKKSHMTGGAVDVSLTDAYGNLLPMGTELNHGSPEDKSTLAFENIAEGVITAEQKKIRENRRILFEAMSKAGFINSPLAWFHWDYGNLWWAKVTGNDAFYGPVNK